MLERLNTLGFSFPAPLFLNNNFTIFLWNNGILIPLHVGKVVKLSMSPVDSLFSPLIFQAKEGKRRCGGNNFFKKYLQEKKKKHAFKVASSLTHYYFFVDVGTSEKQKLLFSFLGRVS